MTDSNPLKDILNNFKAKMITKNWELMLSFPCSKPLPHFDFVYCGYVPILFDIFFGS